VSLTWLVGAYTAVLLAELIGDKSLVTVAAFAGRYNTSRVVTGLVLAFGAKSLVAVMLGRSLGQLPTHVLAIATAVAFYGSALAIWDKPTRAAIASPRRSSASNQLVAVFASVFFSEWADVGQLTTASLAARSGA
jgi:putative Ca2+/H+ antiporter (TMEM165/GDT1 family)